MKNQLSLSHNRIKDRITNALIGYEGATPKYQNINISKYNYINLASTNSLSIEDNLEASLGASFTWISQIIDNNVHQTDDRYLLNMGVNAGLTYSFPEWGTSISGYYKWTGKSQLWTATTNGYIVSEIEPYAWLDASIKQTFLNKKMELTLGARNLLDVTDVRRTLVTSGHDTSSSVLLGYGRTFFLKLTYNLDINY